MLIVVPIEEHAAAFVEADRLEASAAPGGEGPLANGRGSDATKGSLRLRPRLCHRYVTYAVAMTESEIVFSITPAPEGGFDARALGHSIFTQADTLDELRDNVRDAVRCHFDDGVRPTVIRLHIVHDEVIAA